MNYDIVLEEDHKFIDENLKHFYGETKRFVEWTDSRSLSSKRFKKRLIVVGEYRILSIKKSKVRSISLNKNIHFYDISDIIVVEDTIEIRQKQIQSKTGDQIGILIKIPGHKESLQNILKILREKIRIITHNFPPSTLLKINANESYLLDIGEKVVGIADNFIETYKAQSSYRNCTPSTEVIRLVEKYVQDCVREFDLSKCPGIEGKSELNFSLETVILSLNYNCYFNSIILNGGSGGGSGGGGVSQKGILEKIGEVLQTNCSIRKIAINNFKDEDQSLATLGSSLSSNSFNNLQVLDLHNNHINHSSFQQFADGLESLTHPLRYLNLAECGLNSRCVEILFQLFTRNYRVSSTIEYLNLSGSRFDEVGSNAIANWFAKIKDENALRFLYLVNCNLNLIVIGAQLRFLSMLRTLDISNNRLERSEIEELIAFIKNSRGLEHLNISNCSLNHDYFLYICNTFNKNDFIKSFDLNVSQNHISKSPNIFVSALEFLTNIHSLDLSHIQMPFKTLVRAIDSIRIYCKNINSLNLNACFLTGDKDGMDFINELKQFLGESISLKSLSIAGDHSNFLPIKLMIPFLEYLAKQNAILEELDISYSHLGDAIAPYLADLFEYNSTLKSIQLDRNGFTINTFQTILLSLQNNHTLLNLPFPSFDFEKILTSLTSTQKKSLLFNLLFRIQTILEENGGWKIPDPHFYPTPTQQQLTLSPSSSTLSPPSPSSSSSKSLPPPPPSTPKRSFSPTSQYDNLPLPPPPPASPSSSDYSASGVVHNDSSSTYNYNNNNNYYYDQQQYTNNYDNSESYDNSYYQQQQPRNQNRATLSPTFRAGGNNNRIELTDSFIEAVDHLNYDDNNQYQYQHDHEQPLD